MSTSQVARRRLCGCHLAKPPSSAARIERDNAKDHPKQNHHTRLPNGEHKAKQSALVRRSPPLQSWNKLGSSPWTPPVVFHTLPGTPSIPGPPTLAPSAAITMTSTQLPLVWEPPASNGAPILSYCLQMCTPEVSGHDTWAGGCSLRNYCHEN